MASGQIINAFDEELDTLRGTVCEMGGLAEQAIIEAMTALVRGDVDAAALVVERTAGSTRSRRRSRVPSSRSSPFARPRPTSCARPSRR